MTITQDKLFLGADGGTESDVVRLQTEETLELNVIGVEGSTIALRVLGANDVPGEEAGETWHPLAAIAMSDFSVAETISASGVYNIAVGGVQSIKVVNDGAEGNVTVFGRLGA